MIAVVCCIAVLFAGAGIVLADDPPGSNTDAPEELRIETVISIDDDDISELAAGGDSIWALNGAAGTTYEIRTTTNEIGRVIDTEEDSQGLAIADGRVWTVSRGTGHVTTSPLTGELDGFRRFNVVSRRVAANDEGLLSIHAEDERLWVAAGIERPTVALDAESVGGYPPAIAATSLTNFNAIGGNGGQVWGITLDDRLARLGIDGSVEWDQRIEGDPKVRKIAVDDDAAWLLEKDSILRVDPRSRAVSEIDMTVRDIAVGDGFLWTVDKHKLELFLSSSGVSIGSINVDEDLLRVAYADGSAWVLANGGKIFRISMSPEALELTQPVQDDRLVYVYAADGDLWGEQVDGDDVNLVAHRDEDRRPSMSADGRTIAFQRDRAGDGRIFFLDLSTGRERFLGHGGWPTYGPDDRFAYVSRGRGIYGISFVQNDRTRFVQTVENPSHLTWDADGDTLYFVGANGERKLPYRIEIAADGTVGAAEVLVPGGEPLGASYPVAAPDGNRLYVVRACCPNPGAETIYEFGYIDLVAEGRPFVPELELTEAGIGEAMSLVQMDGLLPPGLGDPERWTEAGPADAWLISDGPHVAYLVRQGALWSFANQGLEHPGRGLYDGFGRVLASAGGGIPTAPPRPTPTSGPTGAPAPSPSPTASSSPAPTTSPVAPVSRGTTPQSR